MYHFYIVARRSNAYLATITADNADEAIALAARRYGKVATDLAAEAVVSLSPIAVLPDGGNTVEVFADVRCKPHLFATITAVP